MSSLSSATLKPRKLLYEHALLAALLQLHVDPACELHQPRLYFLPLTQTRCYKGCQLLRPPVRLQLKETLEPLARLLRQCGYVNSVNRPLGVVSVSCVPKHGEDLLRTGLCPSDLMEGGYKLLELKRRASGAQPRALCPWLWWRQLQPLAQLRWWLSQELQRLEAPQLDRVEGQQLLGCRRGIQLSALSAWPEHTAQRSL
mmetsp:Transcript_84722/g.196999  ORF Transcript_84722/g.196999 Transcript_84722/m.196999 type:complete len:200 (-) Transcript_84722:768-1367(-)